MEIRVLDLDDILQLLQHSGLIFHTEQVVNLRRLFDSKVVWDGAVEVTCQRSDQMRFLLGKNERLQLLEDLVPSLKFVLVKLPKRQLADIKAHFTHLFFHSFKTEDVFHKFLEVSVKRAINVLGLINCAQNFLLSIKCLGYELQKFFLVLEHILPGLLLEIVTVDPFVSSFLAELPLKVLLGISDVIKLLFILVKLRCIVFLSFLDFTSGGPNDPLLLIIALKQLEFEYSNLTELVKVDVLLDELAGVVFEDCDIFDLAGLVDGDVEVALLRDEVVGSFAECAHCSSSRLVFLVHSGILLVQWSATGL